MIHDIVTVSDEERRQDMLSGQSLERKLVESRGTVHFD
jgi:hypothetical protein